jgi:hypothetical protein
MFEIFPFEFALDATQVAGTSLWSLACYWAFSPLNDWFMLRLQQWFNFAERSLYFSQEEFDRTKVGRESQNAFAASMFSIVPFFILGGLLNYAIEQTLGSSWPVSLGVIGCMAGGIYELGRYQQTENDNNNDDDEQS